MVLNCLIVLDFRIVVFGFMVKGVFIFYLIFVLRFLKYKIIYFKNCYRKYLFLSINILVYVFFNLIVNIFSVFDFKCSMDYIFGSIYVKV